MQASYIAVDRDTLFSIAQQMSSGMIVAPVLAAELHGLIAKALPTIDPVALSTMRAEIATYSMCRCGKSGDKCRRCRILAA